jgi:hypothetical protein
MRANPAFQKFKEDEATMRVVVAPPTAAKVVEAAIELTIDFKMKGDKSVMNFPEIKNIIDIFKCSMES